MSVDKKKKIFFHVYKYNIYAFIYVDICFIYWLFTKTLRLWLKYKKAIKWVCCHMSTKSNSFRRWHFPFFTHFPNAFRNALQICTASLRSSYNSSRIGSLVPSWLTSRFLFMSHTCLYIYLCTLFTLNVSRQLIIYCTCMWKVTLIHVSFPPMWRVNLIYERNVDT